MKSFSRTISPPKLPLIISICLFIAPILYLYNRAYDVVSFEFLALSILDYALTLFIFGIFVVVYKTKLLRLESIFKGIYQNKTKSFVLPWLLIAGWSVLSTYVNLKLVINEGYNREGLLNTVDAGYLDMLLPSLFNCLFVVAIIFKYPARIRIILFVGVLSTMLFYLSRSNLLFLILFPFGFMFVINSKLNSKTVLKMGAITFLLVAGASYVTILQGRGVGLVDEFVKITDTLLRYRSYGFFLSEYAIDVSHGVEKSVFPFFGWLSEKFISYGWVVSNPISVYNSEFVYEFRQLGSGYRANVLYPWWAWFYGFYGIFGLILKGLYIYSLLWFFLRYQLCLCLMYFIYIILFLMMVQHPFINAAAVYSFGSLLLYDILMKFTYKIKSNG